VAGAAAHVANFAAPCYFGSKPVQEFAVQRFMAQLIKYSPGIFAGNLVIALGDGLRQFVHLSLYG
jgi:hypothetical protein